MWRSFCILGLFVSSVMHADFYQISDLSAAVQLKHREHRGLGYDTGYSSLGIFVIPKSEQRLFPIADLRAHVFNNGYFASNLGVGGRFLSSDENFGFGVNVFYDFRKWKDLYTSQIAGGVELLTKVIDFRFNGYYPMGQRYKEKMYSLSSDGLTLQTRYALPSADVLISGRAITGSNFFQIYVGAGPYYLFKQTAGRIATPNALGARANASFHISKWFTIGAEYTYDRLFRARFVGYASINIHLGKKDRPKYKDPERESIRQALRAAKNEMSVRSQPIRRNEIIPMIRRRDTISEL